ncbi:sodium/hydrogen exchanger family protein [Apiospora arundinis]
MPDVVRGWKEAVFMGYFGPIGVGAIYYLEHTTILLLGVADPSPSEMALLNAIGPGVRPVTDDAEPIRRRSVHVATPSNAVPGDQDTFIAFNRFTRPNYRAETLPTVEQSPHRKPAPGVVVDATELGPEVCVDLARPGQ